MIPSFNPPQTPGFSGIRTFQDLRDSALGWTGRFFDYVQNYFNSTILPRLNTQMYGVGADIPSANAINFHSLIHRVTGSVNVQTINIPTQSNFAGLLVLIAKDGFSTITGGNISLAVSIPANHCVILTYDPALTTWYPITS